ncbi:hypothetical protein ACQ86N_02720 [Puia sp. P3]|uniref:hypothetical protein n=1 Tax=Puia sp. P3 TaxID=3423952 RepID=UPI003D6665BF
MYQTIASVLHSLVDSHWEYLTIEPVTNNDKVDMLWEDGAGARKCQQVKSSINNFAKADILHWLTAMVTDVPDAQEYEMILIGNRTDTVSEFVNKLNSRQSSDLSPELQPFADRVHVEMMIFNLDVLQGHVQNEVHRFLSQQNFSPTHDTLVVITGGLLYQFFQFAVFGTRASREQWTEDLLRWVTNNYKRGLKLEGRQDRLLVGVYQQENRKLVSTVRPMRFQLNPEDWLNFRLTEAMEQFNTASKIHLPPREEPKEEEPDFGLPLLKIPAFIPFGDFTPIEISESEKTYLAEKVRQYLVRKLPSDFFNIGNVKQKYALPGPWGVGIDYAGTEEEKAKYLAIRNLRWTFETLDELVATIDFVNTLYYLPFVLENAGSSHDEEVSVTLKVPEVIQIITADRFYVPDDIDVLKLLMVEKPLTSLLAHPGDSFVKPYPPDPIVDPMAHLWESNLRLFLRAKSWSSAKTNSVEHWANCSTGKSSMICRGLPRYGTPFLPSIPTSASHFRLICFLRERKALQSTMRSRLKIRRPSRLARSSASSRPK